MNNEDQDVYDSDNESLFSIVNNQSANEQEEFDLVQPNEAEDAAVNLPPPPVGVAQVAPVIVPPPVEPRRQVHFAAAHRFDQPVVPRFQLPVVIPRVPVVIPQVPVAIAPPFQVAPPVLIPPVVAAAGAQPHIGGPPQVGGNAVGILPQGLPQGAGNVIGGPPQGVGVYPHNAGYPQVAGGQPNIGAPPARGYFPQQAPPSQRYRHGPHGPSYRRFNSRINLTIGDCDPETSSGAHLYNAFTASPFDVKTPITPSNHATFVAGIKLKMQQYRIKVIDIPTSGTGDIPYLPNFAMGLNHPSMDLHDYENLLDNRTQRPSMEDIRAYASWFHDDNMGND